MSQNEPTRGRLSAAWAALTGARGEQRALTAAEVVGQYGGRSSALSTAGVRVTPETALRHSAVWACLRLRANLVSSLPVDAFRAVGTQQIEAAKPPALIEPWPNETIGEYLFASQYDLDRYGNVWGVVHERSPLGIPVSIELLPTAEIAARVSGRMVTEVRVNGQSIPMDMLWHEKQYAPSGHGVGMSPIQAAGVSIGSYLAAQQYSSRWFEQDGAHPSGVLKNMKREVPPQNALEVKNAFKAAVANRDVLVVGNDWEWTAEQVTADSAGFLENMQWGISDVARFLDVPGDMIDAPAPGGAVTYANVTSRMLQLLVLSMGAVIKRREDALTRWLPPGRFAKLNTAALLRLDPEAASRLMLAEVQGRVRAPSEVRALNNLSPFTPEQLAEFDRMFGAPGGGDKTLSPAEAIQKVYLGVGKVLTSDEARQIANQYGAGLALPGPIWEAPQ